MSPLIPALASALVVGGLLGMIAGLRPAMPPSQHRYRRQAIQRWRRIPLRSRQLALGGLVVGVVAFLATGWVLALLVPPLAAVGVPALLGPPPEAAKTERLEAMAEWTRNLAGVLVAGVGLEQALESTLRATPDPIRPEVTNLVGRLRGRSGTEEALRAFADDLDDATGDMVAAYLILGARRRGPGLAAVLTALAESVAEDVASRRQVEADRAKPRAALRLTIILSVSVLALFALSGYLAPYGSPMGQLILAALLAVCLLALLWMRRMSTSPPMPRILSRAERTAP